MRIEGATLNEVRGEQRPYLEYDGIKVTGPVESSRSRKSYNKEGEVESVIEPYIVLVFSMPETIQEFKLVV